MNLRLEHPISWDGTVVLGRKRICSTFKYAEVNADLTASISVHDTKWIGCWGSYLAIQALSYCMLSRAFRARQNTCLCCAKMILRRTLGLCITKLCPWAIDCYVCILQNFAGIHCSPLLDHVVLTWLWSQALSTIQTKCHQQCGQ